MPAACRVDAQAAVLTNQAIVLSTTSIRASVRRYDPASETILGINGRVRLEVEVERR